MSRGRVIVGAAVVLVAVAMLVGPRRAKVRSLAQLTVGSVVIDSAARVRTLHAVVELRLDGAKEEFISFYDLRVARNGNIVVPQGRDWQYRFYSADGKLLARLGRRGRGPGEFQTSEGSFGWTGDTLWIWDGGQDRLTYASADGRYLDDESVQFVFAAPRDWFRYPPLMQVQRVEGIRDGEMLLYGDEWKLPIAASWLALRRPLVAVGTSGALHRVVGDFPFAGDSDAVSVKIGDGPRPYQSSLPLRAFPHTDVADDASRIAYLTTRVVDASGGFLRLTVVAASGDTLVVREYPFVGEPIPKRVSDSILQFRASIMRGNPEVVAKWREAAPRYIQPVYAPVHRLVAGRDSTTWIGLRTKGAQRTWVVLDARGDPIGSVSMPAETRIAVAEKGYVWCVEEDANDVPSVVRYRIEGWEM